MQINSSYFHSILNARINHDTSTRVKYINLNKESSGKLANKQEEKNKNCDRIRTTQLRYHHHHYHHQPCWTKASALCVPQRSISSVAIPAGTAEISTSIRSRYFDVDFSTVFRCRIKNDVKHRNFKAFSKTVEIFLRFSTLF